jgi:release factor glutamine methyltransferase
MDQDQLRFQKTTLLYHLFGISQTDVVLNKYRLNHEQKELYEKKCVELEHGVPFDYVIGEVKTNNGYQFILDQNVLIPRPETEELIEMVKKIGMQNLIVDIGTGSGFIGIQLAKHAKNIIMTDISSEALEVCEKNIKLNHLTNTQLIESNLLNSRELRKTISQSRNWILVANLPYVPNYEKQLEVQNNTTFEPDLALYSGVDGLDLFRELIDQLKEFSLPRCCFFELDDRNIRDAEKILKKLYKHTKIRKDVNGLDRFLIGKNV